jgi:hypothetical protein
VTASDYAKQEIAEVAATVVVSNQVIPLNCITSVRE